MNTVLPENVVAIISFKCRKMRNVELVVERTESTVGGKEEIVSVTLKYNSNEYKATNSDQLIRLNGLVNRIAILDVSLKTFNSNPLGD